MGRKPTGKPVGRPKVEISKSEFRGLCQLHCTLAEVSDFFNVDDDTITAWCQRTYGTDFSVVSRRFWGKGRISARRALFNKVNDGNVAAIIFYAKNYLGMSDNVTHGFDENRPAKVEFVWTSVKGPKSAEDFLDHKPKEEG